MTDNILKPGRYINGEWNSVHKEWKEGVLKVALCFPDIYEIGMSHLGMKILYGILNQEEDVVCDRIFAPWSDMEKKIRLGQAEFLSLESGRRLKEFDIIGFSLQYEMNFVDVLNMLDLGGVPIFSNQRSGHDSIVIAGGVGVFNPEVMADFIDVFVVGEAEEAILEIVSVVRSWMLDPGCWRTKALEELSKINGVYVPISSIQHPVSSIKKRIIKNLDTAYFPTNPIVPYIQIVHDRIGIEIMRGCPHRCRFCQASKIFQPLRIRSVEKILEITSRSVENTGYEEISLLSLSTCDYPFMEELVRKLEERFRALGVKISLPSLRVETFNNDRMPGIVKRAGLTFAPEAGSDRLRNRLNKTMENEDIIKKANLALKSGWRKVKLYFMLGLPDETYEDLDAIIELSLQIKSVSLSINPFIPKPHSGFERGAMDDVNLLKDKQRYLLSRLNAKPSGKRIRVDFPVPEMSVIEAVISRGDRKVGGLIYRVWEKGARLQAWGECFDYKIWEECFTECGIDPKDYLKKRLDDEILPWSFVEA